MNGKINIRHFMEGDRRLIRQICYETAFMGEPPEDFFNDKEILADIMTSYYTDYEPESTFVADLNKDVAGYLTGCKDTERCTGIKLYKIFPKTLLKGIAKGLIFRRKVIKLIYYGISSLVKGELKAPPAKEYPAHLHINVIKNYRKNGIGSALIDAYIEYLKSKGIKGVHLVTVSEDALPFFNKKGFQVLTSNKLVDLSLLLKQNLTCYTLARKI